MGVCLRVLKSIKPGLRKVMHPKNEIIRTVLHGDFLSLKHIMEVLSSPLTCHYHELVKDIIYMHHLCPIQVKLTALFYLYLKYVCSK